MRRILVPGAQVGPLDLPPAQAHHIRDVLRLAENAELEIFDAAGTTGHARIISISSAAVSIQIDQLNLPDQNRPQLTVAAAIPKATRADWMIEKLSELGVDRFIPLAAERSVVLPAGQSKLRRWQRLAEESARQSSRIGVMQIAELTELKALLDQSQTERATTWYLSPAADATPIVDLAKNLPSKLLLLIGPEGGWSPTEIAAFTSAKIPAIGITRTILRVETAAIAAAAIIQSARHPA